MHFSSLCFLLILIKYSLNKLNEFLKKILLKFTLGYHMFCVKNYFELKNFKFCSSSEVRRNTKRVLHK